MATVDALSNLCTSIPSWNVRLDELNAQIAHRQVELARLDEELRAAGLGEHPPPRSLRNKGSTESLRPKDGNHNSSPSEGAEIPGPNPLVESPTPVQNGFTKHPTSVTPLSSKAPPGPPLGAALTRQSSQPTPPTYPRLAPAALKKRKTESLASEEETPVPKYRTRSMIIVYYDSAVQTAFEELVRFVSGSRNAMRKGKMAAKMAEMRRAAELEVGGEDAEDDEMDGSRDPSPAQKNGAVGRAGACLVPSPFDAAGDFTTPRLPYVSTRNMGPPRDFARSGNFGSTLSVGLLRGYRCGGDSAPDVFDELDKGLEWCQCQCEHAAHQFLRDGDCNQEVANIRRKLMEVKESAEKELEKLKEEKAEASLRPVRTDFPPRGKARELKSVVMRKDLEMRKDLGTMKGLEVDMEVDDEDEGIDDMEPSKLIFKRSTDVGV